MLMKKITCTLLSLMMIVLCLTVPAFAESDIKLTDEVYPTECIEGNTFSVYRSEDLEYFSEPVTVLDGSAIGFWADKDFWAPEVHKYNGRYYLFGSCRSDTRNRATQIFVCDTPDGTFVPLGEPTTPSEWECLDGTFWVEDGVPYMIFSHEWTQVGDGEIWAVPLREDLSAPSGEPFLLFKASDNPHVSSIRTSRRADKCYVTDGPFLYKNEGDPTLRMIWSSFYDGRYLVLDAESDSLHGEWRHGTSRFDFDGGHAMIFERLDGKRMISLHAPNRADLERAAFFEF